MKSVFLSRPPVPEHPGQGQPRQQPGQIFAMGFLDSDVRAALSLCNGDEARAIEHLLSPQQTTAASNPFSPRASPGGGVGSASGVGHHPAAPPQLERKFTIHFMHEGVFIDPFVVTATTARDLVPPPSVCIMLVVMFPFRFFASQLWSTKAL